MSSSRSSISSRWSAASRERMKRSAAAAVSTATKPIPTTMTKSAITRPVSVRG